MATFMLFILAPSRATMVNTESPAGKVMKEKKETSLSIYREKGRMSRGIGCRAESDVARNRMHASFNIAVVVRKTSMFEAHTTS